MSARRIQRMFGQILCLVGVLAISACDGAQRNPTAPSAGVPFTKTDTVVGTGATAATEHMVIVSYTGWIYDGSKADHKGTQFDSSNSFGFTLGIGSVIEGWEQGIPGMKVGGTRMLVIPPDLAYGQTTTGPIKGNSTLLFEVKLLGAQ